MTERHTQTSIAVKLDGLSENKVRVTLIGNGLHNLIDERWIEARLNPTPPHEMVVTGFAIREALEFYASEDRWDSFRRDEHAAPFDRDTGSELGDDNGEKARSALAMLGTPAPQEHLGQAGCQARPRADQQRSGR